jgi:hypothetical protein
MDPLGIFGAFLIRRWPDTSFFRLARVRVSNRFRLRWGFRRQMWLADNASLRGGVSFDLPLQFPGCLVLRLFRLTQNAFPYLVEIVGDVTQAGVVAGTWPRLL